MWGGLRGPRGPVPVNCVLAVVVLAAALSISPTYAQSGRGKWHPEKPNFGSFSERINANTVTIVSGDLDAADLTVGHDLSVVLDGGEDFRLLPILGRGAAQAVRDVRFLKGVDLGVTQSTVLNALRRSNELGPLDGKIVYIAKLFNEEMHLVVRGETGITSVGQLAGRKVS